MNTIIDLTGIETEEQLYQIVEDTVGRSFSHNLDALYDVLTEISDLHIKLDTAMLQARLGSRANLIIRMLKDVRI